MNNTIAACIIVRDSSTTIEGLLRSLAPVDFVSITDTGSKDDTVGIVERTLKDMGKPYKLSFFEWCDNFAAARNFNFAQVPPEYEWLGWFDSDDTLEGGENLKAMLEATPDDVGAIWLTYDYAQDEYGNTTTVFERERLLRSKYGWLWKSRLHETVQPMSQCRYLWSDKAYIKHHHGGGTRSGRNFKLLNLMSQEDPNNKRVWLYMGHQHFAEGNWLQAAEWYLKFSSVQDVVPIEKYQTLTYAAKALRSMGDHKQAIQCDLTAMELYPEWLDAYLGMALNYLPNAEWDRVIYWCQEARRKRAPDRLIFVNPLDASFNVPITLGQSYVQKGMFQEALVEFQLAQKVRPTDDVAHNIMALKDAIRRGEIVRGIKAIAVGLLEDKELTKLKELPKLLPYWFADLPEHREVLGGVAHYTKELKDAPDILQDGEETVICLDNAMKPEDLITKHDKGRVRLISNRPLPDSKQLRVLSMQDMEHLVTGNGNGKRIVNLRHEGPRVICEYDHEKTEGLLVRMYVGQGLEHWSPQSIAEMGCGGSETAAAYVAREFAQTGNRPLVYAMDNQVWDAAIFRHHSLWKPDYPPANLVISSRRPDIFTQPVNANQKWLWVHDIHCGAMLTPEIAGQLDAIVALSHWHAGFLKRTYPWLADCEEIDFDDNSTSYEDNITGAQFYPDARLTHRPVMAIIGDGIDAARFEKLDIAHKKPHSFIWCSSPDRGLEQVLGMWPLIRQVWPDATIDIFYGWNYFDSSLHIQGQRETKARISQLIKQEGVTWRGRVGQLQLAQELARSQIWLYPPPHEFRETFCISALEAQAAGVLCFYRMNGALGETVGPERGVPLTLDATPEQIVQRMQRVLGDEALYARLREAGQAYALKQTWHNQSQKMLALYDLLEKRKVG